MTSSVSYSSHGNIATIVNLPLYYRYLLSLPGYTPCVLQCLPRLGRCTVRIRCSGNDFLEPDAPLLYSLNAAVAFPAVLQHLPLQDSTWLGARAGQSHRPCHQDSVCP